jgi:hypothetical protein
MPYAIRMTRHYHNAPDRKSYVTDEATLSASECTGRRLEFASKAEAIDVAATLDDEVYYTSHDESGRPDYKVVKIKPHGNTGNRHAAGKGRPRLPEGQRRVQMQISVKPEQRDMLKRLAADSGVSVSALVIQSVMKSHNNG